MQVEYGWLYLLGLVTSAHWSLRYLVGNQREQGVTYPQDPLPLLAFNGLGPFRYPCCQAAGSVQH